MNNEHLRRNTALFDEHNSLVVIGILKHVGSGLNTVLILIKCCRCVGVGSSTMNEGGGELYRNTRL